MGVGERVPLQRFQNYKELVGKSVSSLHHPRLSQSPSHDFFRFWCARCAFGARFIWFISGVFALFNCLSCLYIVSLPKILASRLVASLPSPQYQVPNEPPSQCKSCSTIPVLSGMSGVGGDLGGGGGGECQR